MPNRNPNIPGAEEWSDGRSGAGIQYSDDLSGSLTQSLRIAEDYQSYDPDLTTVIPVVNAEITEPVYHYIPPQQPKRPRVVVQPPRYNTLSIQPSVPEYLSESIAPETFTTEDVAFEGGKYRVKKRADGSYVEGSAELVSPPQQSRTPDAYVNIARYGSRHEISLGGDNHQELLGHLIHVGNALAEQPPRYSPQNGNQVLSLNPVDYPSHTAYDTLRPPTGQDAQQMDGYPTTAAGISNTGIPNTGTRASKQRNVEQSEKNKRIAKKIAQWAAIIILPVWVADNAGHNVGPILTHVNHSIPGVGKVFKPSPYRFDLDPFSSLIHLIQGK